MTISDIITIISLVIAIVAIISEKNRKHQVIKYYTVLIEQNEIVMLLDLIERYHSNDIVDQVQSSKS